jgi:hypothetical protein
MNGISRMFPKRFSLRCVAIAAFATIMITASPESLFPVHADSAETEVVTRMTMVDPGQRYQVFDGWGTSLCWFANVVGRWPEPDRSEIIGKIFDPKIGLGLNVARYNIGGGENPEVHAMGHRERMDGYEPVLGTWDWSADAGQRWVLAAAMKLGVNHV